MKTWWNKQPLPEVRRNRDILRTVNTKQWFAEFGNENRQEKPLIISWQKPSVSYVPFIHTQWAKGSHYRALATSKSSSLSAAANLSKIWPRIWSWGGTTEPPKPPNKNVGLMKNIRFWAQRWYCRKSFEPKKLLRFAQIKQGFSTIKVRVLHGCICETRCSLPANVW